MAVDAAVWPPESSPGSQGETNRVRLVWDESETEWNKEEKKGGEVAPPCHRFSSPSPETQKRKKKATEGGVEEDGFED